MIIQNTRRKKTRKFRPISVVLVFIGLLIVLVSIYFANTYYGSQVSEFFINKVREFYGNDENESIESLYNKNRNFQQKTTLSNDQIKYSQYTTTNKPLTSKYSTLTTETTRNKLTTPNTNFEITKNPQNVLTSIISTTSTKTTHFHESNIPPSTTVKPVKESSAKTMNSTLIMTASKPQTITPSATIKPVTESETKTTVPPVTHSKPQTITPSATIKPVTEPVFKVTPTTISSRQTTKTQFVSSTNLNLHIQNSEQINSNLPKTTSSIKTTLSP
ncbi:unnamed protein product [Brachionus calyciflorus]|uniref:Uncharacterized protein n=1 Tax=Brachionus calyciflorus TaxID=104777 RepID=A0A814LJ22_9BILA|nr:unnamed protein product [Brachionus calyciflorus]